MASDAVSGRKRKPGGVARCNLGREAILESDSFGFEVLASSLRADAGDLLRLGHGGLIESGAGRRFPPYS